MLPIKPFSVNAMYGLKRNHKSAAYRDWEQAALRAIIDQFEPLSELSKAFDAKQHCFVVHLTTYVPKQILFTKSGHLSSQSYDLSNIEKPIIDLLFLPRYHQELHRMAEAGNINVDDKNIVTLRSAKRISPDELYHFAVSIAIVSLNTLIKANQ